MNASKQNDPRFVGRWYTSGSLKTQNKPRERGKFFKAIGTADPAVQYKAGQQILAARS